MLSRATLLTVLLGTATALCTPEPAPAPAPAPPKGETAKGPKGTKPPFFILAGDSTTAPVQPFQGTTAPGGGGWGDGFLKSLGEGASGINLGHNGQTTASYREKGYWKNLLSKIGDNNDKFDIYVTLAWGHNDQKEKSGVTVKQYEENLEKFAKEVQALKATPIFITPLTRRQFTATGFLTSNLEEQSAKTKAAAEATKASVVDLYSASRKYVTAIGKAESTKLNADYRDAKDATTSKDTTHLNALGSTVFGRIVADLVTKEVPAVSKFIKKDEKLSATIAAGKPVTADGKSAPKVDGKPAPKGEGKPAEKPAPKGEGKPSEKPAKKPAPEKPSY